MQSHGIFPSKRIVDFHKSFLKVELSDNYYQISLIWKLSHRLVKGYCIKWQWSDRTGRIAVPNSIPRTAHVKVKQARERSLPPVSLPTGWPGRYTGYVTLSALHFPLSLTIGGSGRYTSDVRRPWLLSTSPYLSPYWWTGPVYR